MRVAAFILGAVFYLGLCALWWGPAIVVAFEHRAVSEVAAVGASGPFDLRAMWESHE